MDILAIKTAFSLCKEVIDLLKKAKEIIPNGIEKKTIDSKIEEAEKSFKIAESKLAQELGYQLCRCTWPPQIMICIEHEEYGDKVQCPNCKHIISSELPPL